MLGRAPVRWRSSSIKSNNPTFCWTHSIANFGRWDRELPVHAAFLPVNPVWLDRVDTRQKDPASLLASWLFAPVLPFSTMPKSKRPRGLSIRRKTFNSPCQTRKGETVFYKLVGEKKCMTMQLVPLYHHKLKHFCLFSWCRHWSCTYFFGNVNFAKVYCAYNYNFGCLKLFCQPIFGT